MGFPRLNHNPIRYHGDTLKCSICSKQMSYEETNQMWITTRVGTDIIPMLANLCSKECEEQLPKPTKYYVQFPHKGGADLVQPDMSEFEYIEAVYETVTMEKVQIKNEESKDNRSKFLKFLSKLFS
ncbi:hypothetical protein [uncultured Tenacibaculum sp.]|uniref:hypothetical protein n=1 Tax=uncultured Tenacibaculum sp. TaxID=174713 RepID=UPI00261C64AD|nr:hypothetical protein [uncultured Tenacibaculum sp.]